jgi:hypothetical protein
VLYNKVFKYTLFFPLSNNEPSGPKNTLVGCVIASRPLRKKVSHAVIPATASARQEITTGSHPGIWFPFLGG